MKSKISVLIPAYNTGKYISECIESVLAQTYRNLEIIIIDDGSSDDTFNIARRYELKDDRIRIFSITHGGVSCARNFCLSQATGEYILFVDSDDWIGENLCSDLYSVALCNDADITFSTMTMVSNQGNLVSFGDRSELFKDKEVMSGKDCFVKMVETGETYPMVAGNLYRRHLIEDNHLAFEGQSHEDEFLTPQLLKYAKKVCNLRTSSYFYRQRQNSIMHDESNKRERAIALAEISEFMKFSLLKELDVQEYNSYYAQSVYRHLSSLQLRAKRLIDNYILNNHKDLLLVVIEECIGKQYGIGTYVQQLILSQKDSQREIIIVELCSTGSENPSFGALHHQPCFRLPYAPAVKGLGDQASWNLYQKSVSFFLASKFASCRNVICHFNTFGYDVLAKELREKLGAKIIFTLHYTDWSFSLLGNKGELIRRLHSTNCENDSICIKFNKERSFMLECCDHIIAIAEHSRRMLSELYNIPQSKVSLIYNNIFESVTSDLPKNVLRKKYGFKETDKIIIFAGRIEKVKGILELIKAFKIVCNIDYDARLIIAGTGAFSSVFEEANPMWNRISFTGFVNKRNLYELYKLSDIGIVPSRHEEFGYVALEMALSGLYVLVNDTGGLHELSTKIPLLNPIKTSIYDSQLFASEIYQNLINAITGSQIHNNSYDQMDSNFPESMKKLYNDLQAM